ncbi:MAG TPA: hypothetical protein VFB67_09395 [Candidatus Polarisedimenticolaceae bacterium]|nr:hypothetical protein [Candidatus Polarisedimenticolaceae bacterium]
MTKGPESTTLLDRVLRSGSQRVAILGLHPQAGTRTVLAAFLKEIHARSLSLGLTSAPRLPLEQEEGAEPFPVTRLVVPEGTWIATAAAPRTGEDAAQLEPIETTSWTTTIGPVALYRARTRGEVDLHGPGESDSMRSVLKKLQGLSGGLVLVDGGWERRAFAAPGVSDGVVIVLAAGYSATPERSAAAARYLVETLSVPPCDEAARDAWEETASKGAAALLDARGRPVGVMPPGLADPVPGLKTPDGAPVATAVLPHGLNDEFMIPLVRSSLRCTLVVRDATRINVSPVYYKAWLKARGRIQVVRPLRLIGAATNPWNPAGPDADAAEFRKTVATALPDLSVHDVVLESSDGRSRPIWKFWD